MLAALDRHQRQNESKISMANHEMFILNEEDQGTEYITFEKNPTKIRQAFLRKKRTAIEPSPLVVPVVQSRSSKHFLPADLKKCEEMPLFISPLLKSRNPKSEVWYKKQRMGVNNIDSFVKNMALAELNV